VVTVKVPPFKCLFCEYQFTDITVELERIKKLYRETTRPVPVPVKCPNGHELVIFLYTQGDEIRIRSIMPAVGSAETDIDKKKDEEKERKPLDWFEVW